MFVYDLLKVGGVYPYKYLNGVAVTHLRAKARYRVLVVRFTDLCFVWGSIALLLLYNYR